MIVEKGKHNLRLAASGNQLHHLQHQQHHYAAPVDAGGNQPTSGADFEDNDNDEENIVIDMTDEEDVDDFGAANHQIISSSMPCSNFAAPNSAGQDQIAASVYANNNNNNINHPEMLMTMNSAFKLKSLMTGENHMAADDNSSGAESMEKKEQNNVKMQFNVGDLIWFDPNQYGYCIPGKVVDYYQDLNVLTVESCSQVNPAAVTTANEDVNANQVAGEHYNRLLASDDNAIKLYEINDLESFKTIKPRKLKLNHLHNETSTQIDDLVDLSESSIEALIWSLKLRHKQELVYTKCGHKLLISVNPFKQLNHLYELDQVNKYDTLNTSRLHTTLNSRLAPEIGGAQSLLRWLLISDGIGSANESEKSPHIFGIANEALKRLLISGQDQCFILLGESGAGKTEACKLLVQYLATVNKSPSNLMTEQILESIQVLDSFGNAKTLHNDNSSRYGKILNINFDLTNGFITNAKICDLNLLDRSRIVSQVELERNYHIFYELLSGLSRNEKEKYGLQSAEKYFYLNQGHCVELATKEDGDDFRSLMSSMQVLGFNHEEQDTIFRILASVLHLGNIYFHRKVLAIRSGKLAVQQQQQQAGVISEPTQPVATGVEGVEIGSDTEVRWVSHLLQIQFEQVMRCLTVRTTEANYHHHHPNISQQQPAEADRIVTPLNIDQALDTRDAIARALYTCLFKWLVQRINVMINSNAKVPTSTDQQRHPQGGCSAMNSDQRQEPIYLCRTSESLCEFQPDKLQQSTDPSSRQSSLTRARIAVGQQNHQLSLQQVVGEATISILDAFGFENLSENNFEQLCINYTAELLHYHTTRYLLRLEQAEYARERLRWTPIANADLGASHGNSTGTTGSCYSTASSQMSNQVTASRSSGAIVNLICKKPLGILALLDDECNFPKATDQSFAEKCHHNHTMNENYQCARLAANCQEFGIRHFKQSSRLVWYQVDGFIEKNRDNLRPDILELLVGSKMTIIGDMLRKLNYRNDYSNSNSNSSSTTSANKTLSRTYDGRYVSMRPRTATVAAKFQDSLHNNRVLEAINYSPGATTNAPTASQLPNEYSQYSGSGLADSSGRTSAALELRRSNPWFIICLRPSRSKASDVFDVAYVQDQVRSLNLLELVQIRQLGYPVRLRYGEFVRRYKCLVPQKYLNSLESCQNIQAANQRMASIAASESDADYAKYKSQCKGDIKRAIRDVCSSIVEFRFRHDAQSMRQIKSQYQCGLTKMFLNERLYHELEQMRLVQHQQAIGLIQKIVRMWPIRQEFLIKRQAAIVIQTQVRGFLARQEFWRQFVAIVRLQRLWRQQVVLKRRKEAEARRWAQKQQQQRQLQELQAQQRKQANQFRHRQQPQAHQQQQQSYPNGQRKPGAGYLDIPEELAQLYKLQRDHQPLHDFSHLEEVNLAELMAGDQQRKGEDPIFRVPSAVVDGDEADEVKEKMIAELEHHEHDGYSLQSLILNYYTVEAPQFGYSRLPITRPFSWQQLTKSRNIVMKRAKFRDDQLQLHRGYQLVEMKAIAIYKLILRFIDSDQDLQVQQKSAARTQGESAIQRLVKFKLIADYIVYLAIREPLLRDEIFLQLVSQSWQNPKVKSVENVWKLMSHCLSCFVPSDLDLCKMLLKYASDYSTAKFRDMITTRLATHLANPSRVKSTSRQLPTCLLEYWANQQAIDRLALPVSNHSIGDETRNENPTTMVQVDGQTSAEQLAARLLESYQVSQPNLIGWTVEIEHNKHQDQGKGESHSQSYRLRGDELLMDHFARVELLPEFEQIIDEANCETFITKSSLAQDIEATQRKPANDTAELRRQRRLSLAEFSASSHRNSLVSQRHSGVYSDVDLSIAGRLSATSKLNRRYIESEQQRPYAMQGYGDQRLAYPETADYSSMTQMDPHTRHMMTRHERLSSSGSRLNRRSSSMQDLQLASSALNGRYFYSGYQQQPMMQQQQYQSMMMSQLPPGSHHYASSSVSPRQQHHRNQHGSLQQLSNSHLTGAQPVQSEGRRRSQTPNSLLMASSNRMSSSAYGSESHQSSSYAIGGGCDACEMQQQQPARGRIRTRVESPGSSSSLTRNCSRANCQTSHQQRPRRSSSSSSRTPRFPQSDYSSHGATSSHHSDYDRLPNAASNHLSYMSSKAPQLPPRHHQTPLASIQSQHRRPQNPQVERYRPTQLAGGNKRLQRHQQQAPSLHQQVASSTAGMSSHYVASSAMSDTSEAPSLASHVRRVEAPQHNGDLDRYLDDLFNPLLDGADLDELSDARSLAASIQGRDSGIMEIQNIDDQLSSLCNPKALSKLIQGIESSADEEVAKATAAPSSEGIPTGRDGEVLSPTFESLLLSLKSDATQPADVDGEDPHEIPGSQQIPSAQLEGMNLRQLKALNERLEHQIQAAQSNRPSLELVSSGGVSSIPAPPPQPMFGAPLDDLYSRAKTIRIGKVRWPPAAEQGAPMAEPEAEKLPAESLEEAPKATPETSKVPVLQQQVAPETPMSSIGRLKISSEMKAKLEQLTIGSRESSTPTSSAPNGAGKVSQVRNQLLEQQNLLQKDPSDASTKPMAGVQRLADRRKNLLESQLVSGATIGADSSLSQGASDESSRLSSHRVSGGEQSGSKVLAAKQQLAAAAGVALAALDNQSRNSSQASSRRQSVKYSGAGTGTSVVANSQVDPADHRRSRVLHDELGPQSRTAISQRQAFYQMSVSSDQLDKSHSDAASGMPPPNKLSTAEHCASEMQLRDSATSQLIPPPVAISSDNLTNSSRLDELAAQVAPGTLTRAMQMSSDLNEAGQSSALGQASDRLFGQSIAKSLAQRQQETLLAAASNASHATASAATSPPTSAKDQWVSSSPDPTLERLRRSRRVSGQRQEQQSHRAPASGKSASKLHQEGVSAPDKSQAACHVAYTNVDWQIKLRKEFFLPSEGYDNPLVLQLLVAQLVVDVHASPHCHWTRLNNKERAALKSMMKENSIPLRPADLPPAGHAHEVKRSLVRMARAFGLYFTRTYPANNYALLQDSLQGSHPARRSSAHSSRAGTPTSSSGSDSDGREPDDGRQSETRAKRAASQLRASGSLGAEWVDLVAIHHSGLRLVAVVDQQQPAGDSSARQQPSWHSGAGPAVGYKVLETLKYRDMGDVRRLGREELLVSMRNGKKSWLISSQQVISSSIRCTK